MKRVAVLTGGAIDGNFTAGRHYILNKDYDVYVVNSVGSLLSVLFANKEHERLKKSLSVNNDKVLDTQLFNKSGNPKILKGACITIASNLFKTRATYTTSNALRKHIDESLTIDDYNALGNKEIIITVHSVTYNETVYISSKDVSFEDFKDWIWISSNASLAMSIVKKCRPNSSELEEWVDGGAAQPEPIEKAIEIGGKNAVIDVYMHRPKPKRKYWDSVKSIKQNKKKLELQSRENLVNNNLQSAIKISRLNKCKLSIYWMPKEYYDNAYYFTKERADYLYEMGVLNANKNIDRYGK